MNRRDFLGIAAILAGGVAGSLTAKLFNDNVIGDHLENMPSTLPGFENKGQALKAAVYSIGIGGGALLGTHLIDSQNKPNDPDGPS